MEFITILAGSQLMFLPTIIGLLAWTFSVLVGMVLLGDLLREPVQEVPASADATWSGWFLDEDEDPAFEAVLVLSPAEAIEEAKTSLTALDSLVLEISTLTHQLDRVFDPAGWFQAEVALAAVESLYERLALDEDRDPGVGANLEFVGPMTAGGYWVDRNGRVRDQRGRFAPKAALKGHRRSVA